MRTLSTLNMLALCSLALIASACGRSPVRETGQFEPYVQAFEQEAQARGVVLTVDNLIIRFGETEAGERGFCEVAGDQTPVITLSADAWVSSTESEREETLFHEMGHCVLGRAHVEDLNANGMPKSMMYPRSFSGNLYSAVRGHYLNELFLQSN